MHVTQGTFSYLPPLTDAQIRAQVQYALDNGWALESVAIVGMRSAAASLLLVSVLLRARVAV